MKSPAAPPDVIDTTDIPELDAAWFQNARLRRSGDTPQRALHIDADIVEFFRQRASDDEAAINAVLRSFVERAKEKPRT